MKRTPVNIVCLIILLMALTACNRGTTPTPVLPTEITSPELAVTEIYQTENAPPVGFREPQSFPLIDANLASLTNWQYEMTLEFDGVFAGTPRQAQASTRVEVSYNQVNTSRRVVVEGNRYPCW